MNKTYLRLKKDISLLVADGNWALYTGDMIVFQKIGTRSEIKHNEYTHTDSYLLTGFEYRTIKNISNVLKYDFEVEYHMVWNECNSVDTIIKLSTGAPFYNNRSYNYNEILHLNKSNTSLVGNLKYDDVFEDVSITYNREDKLKEILK